MRRPLLSSTSSSLSTKRCAEPILHPCPCLPLRAAARAVHPTARCPKASSAFLRFLRFLCFLCFLCFLRSPSFGARHPTPSVEQLLPRLAYQPEGIVAKLANPTDRSVGSLLLASVAPCIGAPLFEELQSRAFILQALTAVLPLRNALLAQGKLKHHATLAFALDSPNLL